MQKRKFIFALAAVAGLSGCGSQVLEDYADGKPELDLRDYLNGPLTASGIFFDRAGRAELHFVVDMEGSWQGNTGILAEQFRYSDGRTDERVWALRFQDSERFTGTADDVVGEAQGMQTGNAATMTYRLRIPREDGEIVVSMEDWFYLQDDGTLINKTKMRKYGLTVGELVIAFRKQPE
ncbi:MAG: DUF3833 domain-containing protein [Paracoccaceae bacterium]|nr:DUF3833 domain-containing protein [Paracoccaceae bacterium]